MMIPTPLAEGHHDDETDISAEGHGARSIVEMRKDSFAREVTKKFHKYLLLCQKMQSVMAIDEQEYDDRDGRALEKHNKDDFVREGHSTWFKTILTNDCFQIGECLRWLLRHITNDTAILFVGATKKISKDRKHNAYRVAWNIVERMVRVGCILPIDRTVRPSASTHSRDARVTDIFVSHIQSTDTSI